MPPIPKAPKLPSEEISPATPRAAPAREPITCPVDVDTAATDRDQALQFVWQGFKLLSVGFLVGAVAVHAIALVRMTRKVETLSARLDDVVLEQERIAAATRVPIVRPVAPNSVAAAAPTEPDHLVFPALDVGAKEGQ